MDSFADPLKRKHRNLASSAFKIVTDNLPSHTWKVAREDRPLLEKLVHFLKPYRKLVPPYGKLTNYRNGVNHAGMDRLGIHYSKFAFGLAELLDELKPFFVKMSKVNQENEQT